MLHFNCQVNLSHKLFNVCCVCYKHVQILIYSDSNIRHLLKQWIWTDSSPSYDVSYKHTMCVLLYNMHNIYGSYKVLTNWRIKYNEYICNTFIHLVVCLTTGPKPLPNWALQIVRSITFSFKCEYPLLSLRSSSSFLRFLPRLPVTSIPPFIFPSITCCRRQFLCKMWPIQLAFRFLISCRIFLCSLTLSYTSSFLTWSVQLIFSILLQHHISKLSRCFWSTAQSIQV